MYEYITLWFMTLNFLYKIAYKIRKSYIYIDKLTH